MAAIESTGGIDYASRVAQRESELALEALKVLPETPYRRGLAALAEFAVAHTTPERGPMKIAIKMRTVPLALAWMLLASLSLSAGASTPTTVMSVDTSSPQGSGADADADEDHGNGTHSINASIHVSSSGPRRRGQHHQWLDPRR